MIDLLKGLAIGAIISLPVGPIGILCLRRMLLHGPLEGIAAGLGAATTDIFFALTALLGISYAKQVIEDQFTLVRLLGSFFLCLIGLKLFLSKVPQQKKPRLYGGIVQSYFSTLLLTAANPFIIFSFVALFAVFKVHATTAASIIPLSIGIFLGSAAWWVLLGALTSLIHPKLNYQLLEKINKLSAIIIIMLGLFGLFSLLIK